MEDYPLDGEAKSSYDFFMDRQGEGEMHIDKGIREATKIPDTPQDIFFETVVKTLTRAAPLGKSASRNLPFPWGPKGKRERKREGESNPL